MAEQKRPRGPVVGIHHLRGSLEPCIDEIVTIDRDINNLFIDGIQCSTFDTFEDMTATNIKFSKSPTISGFMVKCSFSTNSITPEYAHKFACQLTRRIVDGKRQALVATHDTHSHIIINNVSHVDGSLTQTFSLFQKLKEKSAELCIEHGMQPPSRDNVYERKRRKQQNDPEPRR